MVGFAILKGSVSTKHPFCALPIVLSKAPAAVTGSLLHVAALVLVQGVCFGQDREAKRHTISGFVSDSESGEFLPDAHVYDSELGLGAASNTYGFFSLTLPADSVRLIVSHLGYVPQVTEFHLTEDRRLDVALVPVHLVGDSITISAERALPIEEDVRMSTIQVPIAQIQSMPSILGEADPLRSLQLLPGVHSGSEASSGVLVRGGSGDQTLLLLDGARVYNTSHLFGFFSVFNSDALKHVELAKGGFPARYGGTLASVLEMVMKEGNAKRFAGQAAIGAVASRVMVEGPVIKDKASYIISGRRTYLDILTRPFMKDEIQGFSFYDLNAKLNGQISHKDRLYVSLYHGRDGFSFRDRREWTYKTFLRWGNVTSTARWNRLMSDKLFSNVTATFSDYKLRIGSDSRENGGSYYQSRYVSGIREARLTADLEYIPSPGHYFRFGASGSRLGFRPGALSSENEGGSDAGSDIPVGSFAATELALYAEDEVAIGSRLKLNAGVRLAAFSVTGRFFSFIEPRLSVRYILPGQWALKGSYARMHQYVFLLHNSGVSLPTDLWLPVTNRIPPQGGHITAIGLARSLSGSRYELSTEGYYRTMSNQVEYKNGARFLGPGDDWQDKLELGRGWSYGGEFFLQKRSGSTTGWAGYALTWTYRQFDNLNRGASFPYKYDRRHDVSVVLTHRLNPELELSGLWTYATGAAITVPTQVYRSWPTAVHTCADCLVKAYESRNNYRARSYHRLDLGFNFIRQTGRNERIISIGLYNAYNRKNPFYLYSDLDNGREVLKQVSLLPIVPYVTYRRTF